MLITQSVPCELESTEWPCQIEHLVSRVDKKPNMVHLSVIEG